eukprot:2155732-Pyramimonas_sp.AAC.1
MRQSLARSADAMKVMKSVTSVQPSKTASAIRSSTKHKRNASRHAVTSSRSRAAVIGGMARSSLATRSA